MLERNLIAEAPRLPQIGLFGGFACQRNDLVPKARHHVDRKPAHPAGRAGDQYQAIRGREPVCFHAHHAQRRREARGAERHRFEEIQTSGQGHHPGCGNACVFGIAAMMRNPDIEARRDNRVAGLNRSSPLSTTSPEIDSADAGEAPYHLAGARDCERVLVVDTGIMHPDQHLARVELIAVGATRPLTTLRSCPARSRGP